MEVAALQGEVKPSGPIPHPKEAKLPARQD
jgi:hypothetical protein